MLPAFGWSAQGAEGSNPPAGWEETYGKSAVWVDTNAPWPDAAKKGLWRSAENQAATQTNLGPQEAVAPTSVETNAMPEPVGLGTNAMPELPAIEEIKVTKNEIGASVDFLFGKGNTTMPFGFSLNEIAPGSVPVASLSPDRFSSYLGATLTYSRGQAWYVDLSYANGDSSGTVDLNELAQGQQGEFQIKDDWLQGYIRYAFPQLRGKRLSAYIRGGVTFIQSTMDLETTLPQVGLYTQNNKTEEVQGNLGFGVLYSVYTTRRIRLGLQFEGEGFGGNRSQDSLEELPNAQGNIPWTSAKFDTLVYGGLARGTVRFEYAFGKSGLFRLFGDAGAAVRYTMVDYSDIGETPTELLWGPYVKVGARYSF